MSNYEKIESTFIAAWPMQHTLKDLHEFGTQYFGELLSEDLHVTLLYSADGVISSENETKMYAELFDNMPYIRVTQDQYKGWSIFGSEENYLVLEIDNPELKQLNEIVMKHAAKDGITSSFPEYKAHMTFVHTEDSSKIKEIHESGIPFPNFDMYLRA